MWRLASVARGCTRRTNTDYGLTDFTDSLSAVCPISPCLLVFSYSRIFHHHRRRERTRSPRDIPQALPNRSQESQPMGTYDIVCLLSLCPSALRYQKAFDVLNGCCTRYNRVNGLHVSENSWLIDDLLRKVRVSITAKCRREVF